MTQLIRSSSDLGEASVNSVLYPGQGLWFGGGPEGAGVKVFHDHEEPRVHYWFRRTVAGECLLGRVVDRLCYLGFTGRSRSATVADLKRTWPRAEEDYCPAGDIAELTAIFDQAGRIFRIPKLLVRGTELQVSVWAVLTTLPYGLCVSYGQLADRIGRPTAARAVGNAIAANSIGWIIPCHRIVLSNGHLGGYRWGSEAKKRLLDLERE